MARLVERRAQGPLKLEPNGKTNWICQCGLSKDQPFCDGSHTRTLSEKKDEYFFYSDLTQRRTAINGYQRSLLEQNRNEANELLFENEKLKIFRIIMDSPEYSQVLSIRELGGSNSPIDIYDTWSDIYLMCLNDSPCSTMRVTQARDGHLDIEQFYPNFLKRPDLRTVIGSANRLYKRNDIECSPSFIYKFIVEVWKDQYTDGMRIDLINTTLKMVPYYLRLGYLKVGEPFEHPRTKIQSVAMVYFANIGHNCKLTSDLKEFYIERGSDKMDFEGHKSLVFENQEMKS